MGGSPAQFLVDNRLAKKAVDKLNARYQANISSDFKA